MLTTMCSELDFDEEGEVTGKIDTVGELKELVTEM